MKKIFQITFIILLMLCLPSCGSGQNTEAKANVMSKPEAASEGEAADVSAVLASAKEDAIAMLPVVASEVEYLDIYGGTLDLANLCAEDFWNIVSIAIGADPDTEAPDTYGVYHISFEDMYPYIETLVYKTYSTSGLPSITESYSVSKDPWSDEYDVVPLSLNNKKYSVEDFIESTESWFGEDYILKLSLTDGSSQESVIDELISQSALNGSSVVTLSSEAALAISAEQGKNVWGVCLKYWDDGENHRFPMQVVNVINMD